MKRVSFYLTLMMVSSSLLFTQCKKDDDASTSTSSSALSSNDVKSVQELETQDAVMDQVDQNTDNTMDELETSGFTTSNVKSAETCVVVTVDKADTIQFPKTITLTYDNCVDTVAGEIITLNGTISIVVDTVPVGEKMFWRNHLKRVITFTDYTVKTDSSTFVLNGTRTMYRKSVESTLSADSLSKRTVIKDTINSNFTLLVTYYNSAGGEVEDTITRNAEKLRTAYLHFSRISAKKVKWHHITKADTVVLSGKVYGVNANGDEYSRTFTTPLTFTHGAISPYNIVITGVVTVVIGDADPFTITYQHNSTGTKTVVTLNKNGQTKVIERRVGRRYIR